jgi:hypothetical protein
MNNTNSFPLRKKYLLTGIFDFSAIALIFFVPAISHCLALPVYIIEPMRIILILSILYTAKTNAYILAFTLPMFSFIVSAHPVFLKMLLITIELTFNVWLFFVIQKYLKYAFISVFISIIASKSIYYILKFILISTALLDTGLVSTPLSIQVILTIALSLFTLIFIKKVNN